MTGAHELDALTVSPSVLIRADASAAIGSGHVMRCLSLAHAWAAQGGAAVFACSDEGNALVPKIREAGHKAVVLDTVPGTDDDARQTLHLADEEAAGGLVVDGYAFDARFQRMLAGSGLPLLWIDDFAHANPYTADLILNQNLYAEPGLYGERDSGSELLLGTPYALLRPEFAEMVRGEGATPTVAAHWIVTLGGSDPTNATGLVAEALGRITSIRLEVRFIVGALYQHEDTLRAQLATMPHTCAILRNTPAMSEHMAWADAAIIAGGTTAWEACCAGLPCIVLVLADNQKPIAETLVARKAAFFASRVEHLHADTLARRIGALATDGAARLALSQRARGLVDGQGAARVARRLHDAIQARAGAAHDPRGSS